MCEVSCGFCGFTPTHSHTHTPLENSFRLQVPVILGHHVGLLAVAGFTLFNPNFFGNFYLGWSELSNIPLQVWDTSGHLSDVARDVSASATTQRRLARLRDLSCAPHSPTQ